MNDKKKTVGFDEKLIWIYDPHYARSTDSELAKDPLADFDHPMMVVDESELDQAGHKIEFV